MARHTTNQIRPVGMAAIAILVIGLTQAPMLFAQSGASVQVSATVISVSPAVEAIRQVGVRARQLASPSLTARAAVPERVSTSDRLIQLRTLVTPQGETPDQVRMTLEYAAN